MDPSATAELKTLLSGVDLPADKSALLEYAVQQRAEPSLLDGLRNLPEREYESLDEVAEALLHVQPIELADAPPPREESGTPPGGADYVTRAPESGHVRDLDSVKDA